MPRPDRFFTQLIFGSAPLLVWGAHFFIAYIAVAVVCTAQDTGSAGTGAGFFALRIILWLATAVAVAAVSWLLYRARLAERQCDSSRSLLQLARVGSAVLALIGITLTTVPMLMLAPCG